jgi:hypothetical protein
MQSDWILIVKDSETMEHIAATRFREYLRIKTVQPDPDYKSCSLFLEGYAKELGLLYRQTECVPGKPIVIMTLVGSNPKLPSVILNSHTGNSIFTRRRSSKRRELDSSAV